MRSTAFPRWPAESEEQERPRETPGTTIAGVRETGKAGCLGKGRASVGFAGTANPAGRPPNAASPSVCPRITCAVTCACGVCAWALTRSREGWVQELHCSHKGRSDKDHLNWGPKKKRKRVWEAAGGGWGQGHGRVLDGALLLDRLGGKLRGEVRRAASRPFHAELFFPPSSLAMPLTGRSPGTVSHIHSPFLLDLCCRVERPSLTSFSCRREHTRNRLRTFRGRLALTLTHSPPRPELLDPAHP